MFEYSFLDGGARARWSRARIVGLAVSLVIHGFLVLAFIKVRINVKIFQLGEETVQTVVIGPRLKYPLPRIVGGSTTQPPGAGEEITAAEGTEPGGGGGSGTGTTGGGGETAINRPIATESQPAGAAAAGAPGAKPGSIPAMSGIFQRAMTSRQKSGESKLSITLGPPGTGDYGSTPTGGQKGGIPPDLLSGLPLPGVGRGSGIGPGTGTGGSGTGSGTGVMRPGRPFRSQRVGISIPAKGIDFTSWAEKVVDSLQKNWDLPVVGRFTAPARVSFIVLIKKNGEMDSIEIVDVSAIEALDQAAMAALRASIPFPPLPEGFPGDLLEILFEFSYND